MRLPCIRYLFCLLGLLTALALRGQSYFNTRYGTPNGAQSYGGPILPTDSGYFMCGQGFLTPSTPQQCLVLRWLDPLGQQRRMRYYARPGYTYYTANQGGLLALPDGGYVLMAGQIPPSGHGVSLLWRFNAVGDTLWTRQYQVPGDYNTSGAGCRTADGGYAMLGLSQRLGVGYQMLLLRTDSLGTLLWYKEYGLGPLNIGYTLAATADHGFLLGGYTAQFGNQSQMTYVVKVDSLGRSQWAHTYGDASWSNGFGVVCATRDGGYAVLSSTGKPPIGAYEQDRPILYKLDAQGQTLWQKEFGPTTFATEFYNLLELPDGNMVGAGTDSDTAYAVAPGAGSPQGVIFKLCANGDSLWYRNYRQLTGGLSENYLRTLVSTPYGGFAASGFLRVRPPDTGSHDAWVFKVDSAGYLAPNGPPVTAQCQPLGVAPAPEKPEAMSIFPNPAPDGRFTLRLAQAPATLTVTDALGRAILTASCEPRTANLSLDLSTQPPGVYALRVTWPDGRAVTRRLVK